jgi:hypothetical protein
MIDRVSSAVGVPVGLAGAFVLSRWFPYPEIAFAVIVATVFGKRIWRSCAGLLSDMHSRAILSELKANPHATVSAEEAYWGQRNSKEL